jgi:hypothetical protein
MAFRFPNHSDGNVDGRSFGGGNFHGGKSNSKCARGR